MLKLYNDWRYVNNGVTITYKQNANKALYRKEHLKI